METVPLETLPYGSNDFNNFFTHQLAVFEQAVVPLHYQTKMIKEECSYSCDTLDAANGLFINLKTAWAVGHRFLLLDTLATENNFYLNIRKVWKVKPHEGDDAAKDPVKLGLGVEGGFQTDVSPLCFVYRLALCLVDDQKKGWIAPLHPEDQAIEKDDKELIFLNSLSLPPKLATAVRSIVTHSAALGIGTATPWEERIVESAYALTLKQIQNPPRIGPRGWVCAECGKTTNLWLHLADGFVGCGRKLFGVADTGCADGREGAAVRHYEQFPNQCTLAVKLGTLTPSSADVFSYPEDSMVIDPLLPQHLQHFCINVQQTTKTEKSLAEMELEYNKHFNWKRVYESGRELRPLQGPGHVGLHNYGNTCYINVVLQMLCRVFELEKALAPETWIEELLKLPSSVRKDYRPADDIVLQLGKVLNSLVGDDVSCQRQHCFSTLTAAELQAYEEEYPNEVIFPGLFRDVSTSQHPEFSSSRQQDAEEYLRYLLDLISVTLKRHKIMTLRTQHALVDRLFGFTVEEQLRSLSPANRVRLTSVNEMILSLPVCKTNEAPNSETDCEASKRPRVENAISNLENQTPNTQDAALFFQSCFENWMEGERVSLRSGSAPHCCAIEAQKTRKIQRFPRYLLVQLRRFYLAEDWTAKKIEDSFPMPETLDLTAYKAVGLSEGDCAWEDSASEQAVDVLPCNADESTEAASLSEAAVAMLRNIEAMGFSVCAARKALDVLGSNATVEGCVEWILAHIDSTDLHQQPQSSTHEDYAKDAAPMASPLLESMGFSSLQVQAALKMSNGDEQQAVEWLMTTGSMLTEEDLKLNFQFENDTTPKDEEMKGSSDLYEEDEHGVFQLLGFCCHMGTNANSGHYTYYARETDQTSGKPRWVLYNDRKVAEVPQAPLDAGYVYIYRRTTKPSNANASGVAAK